MEYFPPKTFLSLGQPKSNSWRLGSFNPTGNWKDQKFYWISTGHDFCGKWSADIWDNNGFNLTSPKFNSEEAAVRWLERRLISFARKEILLRNKELNKEIKNNLQYLKFLENNKCLL